MSEYTISSANLSAIESNLRTLHRDMETVNSNVRYVNDRVSDVSRNVGIVESEVSALAREFSNFLVTYRNTSQLHDSRIEIVRIRQELEQKFGHYEDVRRNTMGILQANDLGIVRRETINTASEELMLATPNYWLAPCLVALAAWIDDKPTLAEMALKEALRRNDENTSLFFALVCRRANRKQASLKWVQRYLEAQDAENLDRSAVIILDAYASGLLGSDSEGVISKQIGKWIDHMAQKPNFIETQTERWSDAINLKKRPMQDNDYVYLPKYSKTWPALQDVMEGAELHAEILEYFRNIFDKESSNDALKAQLDEILTSLVGNFDDEELPLRKEERLHTLIIECDGDKSRAENIMALEEEAYNERKDFTQMLTDAAMNPEGSHANVSTQKFAIALSKDWIANAYNDVVGKNRMNVPHEIQINVDSFNAKTTDGNNEAELIGRFNTMVDSEKERALSQLTYGSFGLYGGAIIAIVGAIMLFTGSILLGIIAIVAGIILIANYSSTKKEVENKRTATNEHYEKKRAEGQKIIRATLAEVVDFRNRFEEKDKESEKVLEFLEQISPDQYVKKLADSNRRIKID